MNSDSASIFQQPDNISKDNISMDLSPHGLKHQKNASVEEFPSPLSNSNIHGINIKKSLFKSKLKGVSAPSGPTAMIVPDKNFKSAKLSNIQSKPDVDSLVKCATQYLLQTYLTCNENYSYQPINNPRRVLTKPSKPVHNDGHDNENWDFILYVNDIIGSQEGHQYQIMDLLGQGTFGQVVKCQNIKTKELMAWKIIKNKPAYYNQSLVEVAILDMIRKKCDPEDKYHLIRMKDHFMFKNHLCIGFEMLSVNLYELIQQNHFRGLSTNLVRIFVKQILESLSILNRHRIIHCDLKPENILLKRYTSSIDMWSLGCIAAEIFLGLPLFPGTSEYNQISRIVEVLGPPPAYMADKGKNSSQFFEKVEVDGSIVFNLKSMEKYMHETKNQEQPSKRYFKGTTLEQIIMSYPIMRKGLSQSDVDKEMQNRRCFVDFLRGVLNSNPLARWSPDQARRHPFITGEQFSVPYIPNAVIPVSKTLNSHTEGKAHNVLNSPVINLNSAPSVSRAYFSDVVPKSAGLNFPQQFPTESHIFEKQYSCPQLGSEEGLADQRPSSQRRGSQTVSHIRKGSSQFFDDITVGSYGSYYEQHAEHPRYGDYGERLRIPSRIPSAATSIDWEPFQDDIYGRSSRQSSFADMSWTPDLTAKQLGSPRNFHRPSSSDSRGRGHNRSLSHSSLNGMHAEQRGDNMTRRPSMPQVFGSLTSHEFGTRFASSLSRHSVVAGDQNISASNPTEIPAQNRLPTYHNAVGSPSRGTFPISPRSSQTNLFGTPQMYRNTHKKYGSVSSLKHQDLGPLEDDYTRRARQNQANELKPKVTLTWNRNTDNSSNEQEDQTMGKESGYQ